MCYGIKAGVDPNTLVAPCHHSCPPEGAEGGFRRQPRQSPGRYGRWGGGRLRDPAGSQGREAEVSLACFICYYKISY